MVERHYIVATAGHVDHGKSALVRALTGIDPDRLPEEKARGITIELGFAHLELELGGEEPVRCRVGVVDVPGHEDFVRNMVSGVGSIDLALLVVAADDGWKPQTEEHLQILTYLGVTRGVVAVTKTDLVEDEGAAASEAVRERLEGSSLAGAPIVGVSVVRERGVELLREAFKRALEATPPPRDYGKPRLFVDRVFTMAGAGTVVTGTLMGGSLSRGQAVVVQPGARATRIRRMQSYHREVEQAGPGARVALNLTDLATDELRRGDVVMLPGMGSTTRRVDVMFEKSGRLAAGPTGPGRPLEPGTRLQVHLGSGHVGGVVQWLEAPVGPGEQRLGRLRLESDLHVFVGDRLVMRDWSEQQTLAGGPVLDVSGLGRPWRDAACAARLNDRARGLGDAKVLVRTEVDERGVVAHRSAFVPTRFAAGEIEEAIEVLVRTGEVISAGESLVSRGRWEEWCRKAEELIRAHHRASPEEAGYSVSALAAECGLESGPILDRLLLELERRGFVRSGAVIREAGHRPALPARLQAAGERWRKALSAKPFDPPPRSAWEGDPESAAVLQFLLRSGEAIEVGPGVILSAEAYSRAVAAVVGHLREHGRATVSELRGVLGTTRRVLVPLLEKLDRERVTRREGDWRVLPPDRRFP